MGEPIGNAGAWAMRIHVKPFIRWIWGGAVLMLLGGFTAATDRRYWQSATAEDPAGASSRASAPKAAGAVSA